MELQARVAANAVDLEQPYLFVTRVDKVEFNYSHEWLDGKAYHTLSTKIYVVSLGRTPAILSISRTGIIFDYLAPKRPRIFWTHHGFHQDTIIVDRNDEHSIQVNGSKFEDSIIQSDYFELRETIVYGTLTYYDMFGSKLETVFGFSAKGLNAEAQRINSRWYNYRKSYPKDQNKGADIPPDTFGF